MGYHVKLEELHNTSSHIIDQTEGWIKQLSRVRASLWDIVRMDMHGEAADAIRAYIQEVHIKILDWILDTIKTYRSSLILYVDGYREIEPDPKGEISQGVLEEQLEQLQREKSEFLQIAENIEQIYRELSQYMAVDSFCAAGVENSYDNAIQFAEKVRTQVGEYEEVHRHDVDSIDEMISNIERIMNLHGGGNSGRYSANGVLDIAGYHTGSMEKLPEYQKAANLNMLQRMYVEQAVERVKAGKSHLVSVRGGAERTPNICVLPIHGVVIAKGVGIGDKEYYGAPISAQRCKIPETVFLSVYNVLIEEGMTDVSEAGVPGVLLRLQKDVERFAREEMERRQREYESNHSVYGIVGDSQSGALTEEQQRVNAEYIYNKLSDEGWSKEAICGLFGNIANEGGFNPGIWQSLDEDIRGNQGYGIVQITPATHFVNWMNGRPIKFDVVDKEQKKDENNALDAMTVDNPKGLLDKELEFLIYSCETKDYNERRWYSTTDYGSTREMTYEEYTSSNLTPEELALIFHGSFERSDDTEAMRQERVQAASDWYDYFNEME